MFSFKSPFEKLSASHLSQISFATTETLIAVSPGGVLFGKFEEMISYLKQIEKNTGRKVESIQKLDAKTLKLIGPASQGIAEAFQIMVKAITMAPDSKEMQEKINAVVSGMAAVVGLGKSIFKFAALLALSLPLLIIGMVALPLAVTMIMLVAGAFYLVDKLGIDKSIQSTSTGLAIAGLAIIALAASFALFTMISPPITAIFGIAAVVIGTGMIFWVIDKLGIDQSIMTASLALMVGGLAIVALGASFALFAMISPPVSAIFSIAAIVIGTGLIFAIVGSFSANIAEGAMAMILATVPIILLGLGFAIFAAAVPPDSSGWITIGQVMSALLGVGVVMAAAGFASVFIAPGAAAMILAGGALIAVSLGLAAMSMVFKGGKLKEMLADSGHKTEGFLGWGAGRMMSNLEWSLLSLARSFTLSPEMILSLYATAPAMIMVGLALVSIARGISKFQALKIDYDVLPYQIEKVTTVLANAFGEIGKKYPGGGGGFIGAIFGNGSGTSYVAQGISAVAGMGRALTSIAEGVQSMANLKFPIYSGTKITGYFQLDDDVFLRLTQNTQKIVAALSSTFGKIGANPNARDPWGWFGHSKIEEGMQIVGDIGSAISSLAEGVQGIANFRMPIYKGTKIIGYKQLGDKGVLDGATKNIQLMVSSLSRTFGKIGASPDAQDSWGWFGHSNVEEGIQIVEDIANPISKLARTVKMMANLDKGAMKKADVGIKSLMKKATGIFVGIEKGGYGANELEIAAGAFEDMADAMEDWTDAVNDLDLKKVTEVRKLYEGLAYLSKNGGETAIEKMGQSLVDALNHLSDLLEKSGSKAGGGGSFFGGLFGGDDDKKPTPQKTPQKPGSSNDKNHPKGKDKGSSGGDSSVAKAIDRLNDILDHGIKVDVNKLG